MRILKQQGLSPHDKRGTTSSNAISSETRRKVIEHISSFPCKETHYGTKEKYYVNAVLNKKIMYHLYKEKEPDHPVSHTYFRNVFKDYFGKLGFGRPQVDSCCTCEEIGNVILNKNASPEERQRAVIRKMVHCKDAKKFYNKMKEVANSKNPKTIAISVDYMQNISLPRIPVQETYYLRQLTVNVFNVHNLMDNSCKFYVYDESQGGKGANEVCSFLYDYLNTLNLEFPKEEYDLILFSDGCGGQNRNHTMVRFLSCLSGEHGYKSVAHYFPIRGHSYLPNDRDFSLVKRKLNRIDRCYTVKEVIDIIASSRTKDSAKFEIKRIYRTDILEFKNCSVIDFKRSVICNEHRAIKTKGFKKQSYQIASYREFIYTGVGVIRTRPIVDGGEILNFDLRWQKVSKDLSDAYFAEASSKKAYPRKRRINIKKMKDLKKFSKYLPADSLYFWNKIYNLKTCTKETEDSFE